MDPEAEFERVFLLLCTCTNPASGRLTLDCWQSVFLSNMGRERRELRAKRDCDEKRLGRDRVCHAREEKQTADSSVIFGDIGSCQNNLIN